jgi:type VI secretion system secreted protein VgrG
VWSGKYTLWDHNAALSDKNLAASQTTLASVAAGTVTQNLAVGGNSAFEIYDYAGGYAKRFDATAAGGGDQQSALQKVFDDNTRTVGIRAQQESVEGLYINGTGNCRRLATGCQFTLAGHPTANGSYALTRVEQKGSLAGSYGTGKSAAFDYSMSFRCIPIALPFRPQQKAPKARVAGSQTAFVVGPKGQEIFTDKYGRVKVQFNWDRTGTNDANSSCWIRVATPWAGKQWGTVHIPRIGMEVLVDFLEGDPDRPIIIGCVYNDANMPPYTLPDNMTQSGVKSRSTTEGDATMFNEFRFEDKKGSELIYCHAQKDFTRVVLNNDKLTVGSSDSNTCSDGSQTIDIYKNRTETVETGNESVTIKQGDRSVTVSQGNDSHTVSKGNRSVTISQGNDTFSVSAGKRDTTISQNDTLEIQQGDRVVKVDLGNDTLTVSAGNQTVTISAGSSTISATQGITLKCGSNSVEITPSGVTISAMMVSITGQTTTTVSGQAMLTLKGGAVAIN